ncbi:MAG: chemotaxis protein CheB [Desulforhopalus sp.]
MSEEKTSDTLKMNRNQKITDAPFSIVGIGSSAGGLEALTQFFTAMPDNSGLAFVLVSHLDPQHDSMLPDLIQNKTKMKVSQVTDNMKVAANQVYIIPPGKELSIFNSRLQLLKRKKTDGIYRPIDAFFRSLAEDRSNKAVGIILSGAGTDGTLGIKAIKAEQGLIIVQNSGSAKYEGMPSSAAATGLADHILPPEQMPKQLMLYVQHYSKREKGLPQEKDESLNHALQKIFMLIRSVTGHDFSQYKQNTISRRIERRIYVHQLANIEQYIDYLKQSEREVFILFKELLIGVTSFFRDPETFRLLKEKYLFDLLKKKPDGSRFRIWVPGCSSGEEVYSLAIIVQESLEALGRNLEVQLFGTDLDKTAISTARTGTYLNSISLDVSEERLKKFFIKVDNQYQVKKNIREMIIFAEQSVIKDPPFTKLDMLSCRNLMIYFGPKLQERLLPTFHYSLNPGGILLLGTSENIGHYADQFTLLDNKWKIFERREDHGSMRQFMDMPKPKAIEKQFEKTVDRAAIFSKDAATVRLLKAILSRSDLPVSVVVNDKGELIYAHGRTGRFLEPAEGEASNNLPEMARPGLKAGLTNAIQKMSIERKEIVVKNLRVRNNGDSQDINLILRPLPDIQSGYRGLMLILFDEIQANLSKTKKIKSTHHTKGDRSESSQELKRLEDELRFTRENLEKTIEELETSNEELKSTNEELQSANEELQSTNEELETSKEELQSLNEESSTVNSELQGRIDELVSANDDIKNLLDATDIATIFLDINLNIRRFTPLIGRFLHLTHSDRGRSIEHFATTLKDVDIKEHASQVLKDLEKYESVVEDTDGQKYRMRVRPFRTVNNIIEGVVITFENITEFKKTVEALTESEILWRELVKHSPVGIFVLTGHTINYTNPAGLKILGSSSPDEFHSSSFTNWVHEESRENLLGLLSKMGNEQDTHPAIEEKLIKIDGSTVVCDISAAPIIYGGKKSTVIYVSEARKISS